jgi:hypothetical protein
MASNSVTKTTDRIQNKWVIAVPVLALLGFGGYKLYNKIKNFKNSFDFNIGIARVQKLDIAQARLDVVLDLTLVNNTGFNIELSRTSVMARADGELIGNTPEIPTIQVADGTTSKTEIPFSIDISNAAKNYQSILQAIEFHSKSHLFGFVPLSYTHTLDMTPYVSQIPGMLDKIKSVIDLFKSMGYVSQSNKTIIDASKYAHLYPKSDGVDLFEQYGEPKDTVSLILDNVAKFSYQTKGISQALRGGNVDQTCRNLWDYYYNHFQYKEDESGKEQVRTPARSFADRAQGIDCDCFAQSILCNLSNLGIKGHLRIIKRHGEDNYTHIYVVVNHNGKEIIIDPVMDVYDKEPSGITDQYDSNPINNI